MPSHNGKPTPLIDVCSCGGAQRIADICSVLRLEESEVPGTWTCEIAGYVSSGQSEVEAIRNTGLCLGTLIESLSKSITGGKAQIAELELALKRAKVKMEVLRELPGSSFSKTDSPSKEYERCFLIGWVGGTLSLQDVQVRLFADAHAAGRAAFKQAIAEKMKGE